MRAHLIRLLGWLAASSALLVAGFLLLGVAAVASGTLRAGGELRAMQGLVWRILFERIVIEALLPQLLLTFVSWLALVRLFPGLDRTWWGLAGGLAAVAALWFPVVGAFSFESWTPTSWVDYANTWLLTSTGVTASLLLPRRVVRPLRPGAFAPPRVPVS
jgi:hypothetical protein